MDSWHTYPSVFALGHKAIAELLLDPVLIEEKIDGSQFSWGLFEDGLRCRSKGATLNILAPDAMFKRAVEVVQALPLHEGWTYRAEYVCLSGDTRVKKASGGQNAKFMCLRDLHALQGSRPINRYYILRTTGERRQYTTERARWWEGKPSLYSLDVKHDRVVPNRITNLVAVGEKEVWRFTTRKGFSIKATLEHPFWTPHGWEPAGALKDGDCVGVLDDRTYHYGKRLYGPGTAEIEARMKLLRDAHQCEECRAVGPLEVHHRNGDWRDNAPDNLQGLCRDCHRAKPKSSARRNSEYEFDVIRSIERVGLEDCFDVEMAGDDNVASFVAEGFIVHNCKPKHNTLCYDRVPAKFLILFDINTGHEEYLSRDAKEAEAARLGLEVVPRLFEGVVSDVQLFRDLLATASCLGGQPVEGIVVKNYSRFGADKKVLMGKFVSEAFKEIHGKEWKAKHLNSEGILVRLVGTYQTPARWAKAVQHLLERGELEQTPRDIGKLVVEVPADVEAECADEIKQRLWDWAWPTIRRGLIRGMPEWYKEHLLVLQFDYDKKGEANEGPNP